MSESEFEHIHSGGPGMRRIYAHLTHRVKPIIEQSAVVIVILDSSDNVNAKLAVELGLAMLLDKPIIALITPGVCISDKLSRLIDSIIQLQPAYGHNAELTREIKRLARVSA